jgi:hypothetical protein
VKAASFLVIEVGRSDEFDLHAIRWTHACGMSAHARHGNKGPSW